MRQWFSVVWAFAVRDARIQASLKMGLFISASSALLALVPFFFIANMIGAGASSVLAAYGGDYFAFVLLGLAAGRYMNAAVAGFAGRIRSEQQEGTLEAMLSSPISLSAFLAGSLVWELVWTTAEVGLYLVIGQFVFSAHLGNANLLSLMVVLVLGLACLSALGLLSACGVLIYKEADPIGWGLSGIMRLLGGVYFPVSLLPSHLQAAAAFLPLTHFLEGLRQAVLQGRTLAELKPTLLLLLGLALILWPLGGAAFSAALRHLKRAGTLSFRS